MVCIFLYDSYGKNQVIRDSSPGTIRAVDLYFVVVVVEAVPTDAETMNAFRPVLVSPAGRDIKVYCSSLHALSVQVKFSNEIIKLAENHLITPPPPPPMFELISKKWLIY